MVTKWETLTRSQQCGPVTETKAVHIQGGHNKNNISKNEECVQKMVMWRCFVRASLNSAGPVPKRIEPAQKIPLDLFIFKRISNTVKYITDINIYNGMLGSSGN